METWLSLRVRDRIGIYLQAVKIRLGHFLGMFHVWELRIKLLKFLQWQSMEFLSFTIWNHCYLEGGITHCKGNKSQTDPSPCTNGSKLETWLSRIAVRRRMLVSRAIIPATFLLLVSVYTPVYSTRAFWIKRPVNRKFDHCVSQGDVMSWRQTPVVSMTTHLLLFSLWSLGIGKKSENIVWRIV